MYVPYSAFKVTFSKMDDHLSSYLNKFKKELISSQSKHQKILALGRLFVLFNW